MIDLITIVPSVRYQMTDVHRYLGLKLHSPFLAKCSHQWIEGPELLNLFPCIPHLQIFICFFFTVGQPQQCPNGSLGIPHQPQLSHFPGRFSQASREMLHKNTITSSYFENKCMLLTPASRGMILSLFWVLFSLSILQVVSWQKVHVLHSFYQLKFRYFPTVQFWLPSPTTSPVTYISNLGIQFILKYPRPKNRDQRGHLSLVLYQIWALRNLRLYT